MSSPATLPPWPPGPPPNTEVDTQKYRNSRYNSDVEVTNTFDDADVNYWANDDEKITYLSRSAWDTTYPTTLETLTVNDKLYNGLNMQTYVKGSRCQERFRLQPRRGAG